jgi:tetratricopeptide (TPR) repeat protein
MVLSWAKKVLGLVVFLAALASTVPLFAQTGGITGNIKDDKGNVLAGYPILIERQEIKGIYKTKTGKHGDYIYIGLPIGTYKVTLQDLNGRTLFSATQRVSLGDPTVVDMDLQKERVRQEAERKTNPEFQKQLEAQTKEQKQFTGLKQIFEQGQALYNEKRYVEAATMFEQALPLAKEKNVVIVLGRLAETYSKAGSVENDHDAREKDRAKALDYYQKAIEANPNDASIHNNLGSLYADMGKTAEAQAEFQKAAELDPTGAPKAFYNLGVTMYNKGKMDEAAAALKKATDLDPKYPDAWYWQALALLGKATTNAEGQVIPAPGTVEALQTYLQLDPNGKWAQAAKDSLQMIQGKVETQYKAPKKKKG